MQLLWLKSNILEAMTCSTKSKKTENFNNENKTVIIFKFFS